MSRYIILAPGVVVESAGARYAITHILSLESTLAKDEVTGKTVELKIANLTQLLLPPITRLKSRKSP